MRITRAVPTGTSAPDASTTTKGIVQLAGDLAGTAASPTVPGLANLQPLDSDLTAIAALSTTSYGRALLALADAAAGRTYLGLGSAATQASTAFDAAGAAAAAQAASQPLDSDLTAIAALSTTTFGRSLLALADAATARTTLGVGAGKLLNNVTAVGRYYPVGGGTTSTQAVNVVSATEVQFAPFVVDVDCTLVEMGLRVSTGATSAAPRLGVYADSAGVPAARLLDAGTVDASTTGVKTVTGLSLALKAGTRYWLALNVGGVNFSAEVNTGGPFGASDTTSAILNGFNSTGLRTGAIGSNALADPAAALAGTTERTVRYVVKVT